MTIRFKAVILKFDKQGEKTGWTYIEIPADEAAKLKPGNKKSFRVKGTLDNCPIKQAALLPMGDGNFILPLNAAIRKKIGKRKGETLIVKMEADEKPLVISPELMKCLADEPNALTHFNSLPKSHQHYYSNWINSAKTAATKAKRITYAINSFISKQSFGEMLRAMKDDRNKLLS